MSTMADFEWFRSTETGKIGKYPARFASRPSFERISSDDAQCVDCWVKPEDEFHDELVDMETDSFRTADVLDPEDEDEKEDN